jgi:hypothetical protein
MTRSWATLKTSILILCLMIFSLSFAYFRSNNPPVWPDEAIYADIAATFLATGNTGTTLWQGFVPHVETAALWYSPMFFHLTALWQLLAGSAYLTNRVVAYLVALVTIALVAYLFKPTHRRRFLWAILPLIGLALENQFQQSTRVYRPEIFVMALILLSLIISRTITAKRLLGIGLLHGFAILLHPLAAVFSVAMVLHTFINTPKMVFWYSIGVVLPLSVWGITIFLHWPLFISQIGLMSQRKFTETAWHIDMGRASILWMLQFITYIITTIWFVYLAWFKQAFFHYRLISLMLISAWIIALWGKMNWYYLYLYPLIYLCFHYLVVTLKSSHLKHLKLLIIMAVTISLYHQALTITRLRQGHYSVEKHYQAILSVVPDHSTVFLSSIPDPYFAFKSAGRHNRLIEFPTLPASIETYQDILSQVDYVIYSNNYDQVLFGDFLPNYLMQHHVELIKIGASGEHQTTVFRLK